MDNDDNIHILPLGDTWEIETEGGQSLAHETDKKAAIDTAKSLAKERGSGSVLLHQEDGGSSTELKN